LENRQKTIKKDIKNIKDVESQSLESGKESMIASLEEERKKLDKQIDRLKDQKQENWQSVKDSVTTMVSNLEMQID
jgi:DNA-binding transcriptional MerR regulator